MTSIEAGSEAPPPSIFATRLTLTRGGADWHPGLNLVLGYTLSDGALPVPIVKLDGEEVGAQTTLTVDGSDRLQVEIDLRDIADLVCERPTPLYLRATAVVNAAGAGFVGGVDSTCDSRIGSQPFLWTGRVSHPDHAAGLQRMIALLACRGRRGRP